MIAAHDPDLCQFVRVSYWQATEPNGIEQLEDRSICADPQPERSDSDERKPRTQPEEAAAISQVLPDTLEPGHFHLRGDARFATFFPVRAVLMSGCPTLSTS